MMKASDLARVVPALAVCTQAQDGVSGMVARKDFGGTLSMLAANDLIFQASDRYFITERGRAYLDMLCKTPFPVTVWGDPRFMGGFSSPHIPAPDQEFRDDKPKEADFADVEAAMSKAMAADPDGQRAVYTGPDEDIIGALDPDLVEDSEPASGTAGDIDGEPEYPTLEIPDDYTLWAGGLPPKELAPADLVAVIRRDGTKQANDLPAFHWKHGVGGKNGMSPHDIMAYKRLERDD